MATFKFFKEGPGVMYNAPGMSVLQKNVNTPAIIAAGIMGGLSDTNDVRVALASTGFAIADILQVFQVPLGFMMTVMGVRVTVAETGGASMTVGNVSATQTNLLAASAAGYILSVALNALGTTLTGHAAAHLGKDVYEGIVFVTNGSIDCTYAGAADNESIWDIFALGGKVF